MDGIDQHDIDERDIDEHGTRTKLVVGLGELLWDMLPEGRQLGGAPANFAVMSARLGNRAAVLSRIGRDPLGRDAIDTLKSFPIDLSHVQVDEHHRTGTVSVTLTNGQPSYVIEQPAAWDFLEFSADWQQIASRTDAVCFGTLAQRGRDSQQTIQDFLAATSPECVRVFDVNLREPFYSPEVVEESMEFATILKMNDGEVAEVLRLLDLEDNAGNDGDDSGDGLVGDASGGSLASDYLTAAATLLLSEFPLQLVCITRGARGSILRTREATHLHPGLATTVADTIGAGDAFTAALTRYYLEGAPLPVLNEAGNRWGAWVASQPGAMPPLSEATAAALEAQIARAAG
ncbi:MAG TPA: carbohydrate kinase [Acidisarcina sp.]|nr:carbohydrate kinase [Acidisarcina sp.]